MSSLQVAEKICTKCEQSKPLAEFYRHPKAPDGRAYWCRACSTSYQKERRRARRKEMGEEAWLKHQREIRNKSYREGSTNDAAQRQAWSAAQKRLRQAHSDEFDAYYREERYKRGLSVDK